MPVITFSRVFPKGHPRAGEPTHFAEKILKGLSIPDYWSWFDNANCHCGADHHEFIRSFNYTIFDIKHHTIRAGNRFKVGDKFSPRVWSGKPYASKQIQFAPDLEVKKVWDFRNDEKGRFFINDVLVNPLHSDISKNDGLSLEDFLNWFPSEKVFEGQIICWSDQIEYP